MRRRADLHELERCDAARAIAALIVGILERAARIDAVARRRVEIEERVPAMARAETA